MKHTLGGRLTEKRVLELAGDVYFKRGREYFADGCVEGFRQTGDSLRAAVLGSALYEVRLWLVGGRICYSCDCPLGREGEFCKHLVAASLAWLADAGKKEKAARESGVTEDDIRRHLAALEKEELIDFIMKQAGGCGDLYDLLPQAAAAGRNSRRRAPINGRRKDHAH